MVDLKAIRSEMELKHGFVGHKRADLLWNIASEDGRNNYEQIAHNYEVLVVLREKARNLTVGDVHAFEALAITRAIPKPVEE
jgi:hypothetical protein